METNNKYTAYYRTPTKKIKLWGITLREQIEKIDDFIKRNNSELLARFIETGSAKTERCICLMDAIEKTKETNSQLIISDSMLIHRDLDFLSILEESNVNFTCVDLPEFNERNIKTLITIAAQRKAVESLDIKTGFKVKKAGGEKLGNPSNLTREGQLKGAQVNRLKAFNNPANKQALALASILRKNGGTLEEIAVELNRSGFRTPRGKFWAANSVHRILKKTILNT